MLRNYLITAIRNLLRNKIYAAITVFGLALGLTSAMLILIFIVDEVSYDTFHSKFDRIYRLRYKISQFDIARVPPLLKKHVKEAFPEIEKSARLWSRSVSVRVGEGVSIQKYEEDNVNFADPEIFQIFDFSFVKGDTVNALKEPFTVILNSEIAQKYFKNSDPIGENIYLEGDRAFKVIGVINDFPSNSHIHADMLIPYDNMFDLEPESFRNSIRKNFTLNWMVSHSPTYVLLKEGMGPEGVNKAFVKFVEEKIPENQQKGQSFELQPLGDIHLNDEVMAQAEPAGSKSFIYIFSAIGILTIIIACINFINLSTAKSLERRKEIGMRKVLGAWRKNIVIQFLGESFIITLIAALLSILLVDMLLPFMTDLTGKEFSMGVFIKPEIIFLLLIILLLTGFIAGLYPSLFVSSFSVIKSLKGKVLESRANLSLRKGLIIFQFVISIVLITSTIVVYKQLNFLRNAPLGFNKDLMITLPIQSSNFNSVFGGVDQNKRNKLNVFENEIKSIPGVSASTLSSTAPGFGVVNRVVAPEGFTLDDNMLCPVISVDYDFLETYQIQLIAGRDFAKDFSSDSVSAYIINEAAVENFHFGTPQNALGKEINLEGNIGKVIAVVSNFNFQALNESISPLMLEIYVPQFNTLSIRLENANIKQSISKLESVWNSHFPDETFDYSFLDQSLAEMYEDQERFGKLVGYFGFLAILISCLGSYALIMFIASQKRKEVGIRKVLGANSIDIILLLSRNFIYLTMASIIISIPISIYLSDYWLNDFANRITLSPVHIFIAAMSTLILIALTVGIHSYRSSRENPINALRME